MAEIPYTGQDRRTRVDYASQITVLRFALTCCVGVIMLLGALVASLAFDLRHRVDRVETTLCEHAGEGFCE